MKTLYKGPLYRVIHSTEEEAECLADGWLPTPEDGKQYIVHTAIAEIMPDPEVAAPEPPAKIIAPSDEENKQEGRGEAYRINIISPELQVAALRIATKRKSAKLAVPLAPRE